MNKEILELYSDYLICSYGQTTATGLSNLLDGAISHDKVTRFLSKETYTSKDLWKHVKKEIRKVESDDAVLIFDDTIQEKEYTDENDLICWHYDHNKNRNMKGINLLNCLYHSNDTSLPVAFELVKKTILFSELKTKSVKRRSEQTKNEMLRNMLDSCKNNQLKYKYILADTWFSSSENMMFIHKKLTKYFLFGIKSNRLIALSETDKKQGCFKRIDSLVWSKSPVRVWVKGLGFPVLIHRQMFTNKDGSTGILYLITNDLTLSSTRMETIYQKRWNVEVFHKNIKSNTALSKSPTRRVRTQNNHVFMSIYASARLECLRIKEKISSFSLRYKLYMKAIQHAYCELQIMKSA